MVPALSRHDIDGNPRRQMPGITADNATSSHSSMSHICAGTFRVLASTDEAAGEWMLLHPAASGTCKMVILTGATGVLDEAQQQLALLVCRLPLLCMQHKASATLLKLQLCWRTNCQGMMAGS